MTNANAVSLSARNLVIWAVDTPDDDPMLAFLRQAAEGRGFVAVVRPASAAEVGGDPAEMIARADCIVAPPGWMPGAGGLMDAVPTVFHAALHAGIMMFARAEDGDPARTPCFWRGMIAQSRLPQSDPRQYRTDAATGIDALLDSLTVDVDEKEAETGYAAFQTSRVPALMLRLEYQLLMWLTVGRTPRRSELFPRAGARNLALQSDSALGVFDVAGAAAKTDLMANVFAQKYRSASVGRFLLSAFAAIGAALVALLYPAAQTLAYVIEIAATISIVVSFVIARKQDWQGNWLQLRFIAERLRLVDGLPQVSGVLLAGRRDRIDEQTGWPELLIDRIARQRLDSEDLWTPGWQAEFLERLKALTRSQIDYNRAVADQLSRMDTRLGAVGIVFFVMSMSLAATALTLNFTAPAVLEQFRVHVAAALAFFPAAGAALFGIRVQLNFKFETIRAQQALQRLGTLEDDIKETADIAPVSALGLSWRLVDILSGDLEAWKGAQTARAMDLP